MKNLINILLFSVVFIGCGRSLYKIPAIPKEPLPPKEEIKYIYKTTQRDIRSVLLKVFQSEKKQEADGKLELLRTRNSIRFLRMVEILKGYTFVDDEVQFKAAHVFLHGGGGIPNDSLAFSKSYFLFKNLHENSLSKKWRRKSKFFMEESYRREHNEY